MNKQHFIDASNLIRTGFCRGAYARDDSGTMVLVDSPKGRCYCIMGAFKRVTGDIPSTQSRPDLRKYYYLMDRYAKDNGFSSITLLNDDSTATPDAEAAAKHLENLASMCE
jgi:hypothetical protein